MQLSDVVEILSGVPFRSRIESESHGVWAVVQARDLTAAGAVDLETAARVAALPGAPKGRLQAGDVVFQPRGNRYSVGMLGHVSSPTVAAAPLLVLRGRTDQLDPRFLVAFLQAPSTQSKLRQEAVGTHVPQVPRQAVEALNIELPDLPSQAVLANLAHLERREVELMDRLREARSRLFDVAIREIAKKSRKRANAPGSNPGLNGARTP
jgi:hypothetical protein